MMRRSIADENSVTEYMINTAWGCQIKRRDNWFRYLFNLVQSWSNSNSTVEYWYQKTVGVQIHAFPITATRVYTRKFQLSITARGTFWSQLHLQDARSDATASDLELISGGCHCTCRLSISRWSSQGNDITSDSPSLVRISKKLHSQSILTRWK